MDSEQFLKDIQGKNVNFLIGAGASTGVIPTLWVDSINKSFEDLLTDNNYSEDQKKVLYYIWFELWIRKTKVTDYDSENITHIQYNHFIKNLIKFLNNEGFDKPKRLNIFTSNYDTLFEMTFDELSKDNRLTYFNDVSFQLEIPTINLLKIHGSVTWSNVNNLIKVDFENQSYQELCELSDEIINLIKNFNNNPYLENNQLFDPETYEQSILRTLPNEQRLRDELDNILRVCPNEINNFYDSYKKFPVVNPTKEKFSDTVFQQHYYQLLRMLSFELEKKDSVLIVFGFSFADEHILEIVRRSIVNPNLKIYVIAYNTTAKDQIKNRLGTLGGNIVEYLPSITSPDGAEIHGNFPYLNSLFDGKVNK